MKQKIYLHSWLWIPDLSTIQSPVVWTLALHLRSFLRAYWHRQYTRPEAWVSTTWYIWPWTSWSRTPRSVLKTFALSVNKKIWNLSENKQRSRTTSAIWIDGILVVNQWVPRNPCRQCHWRLLMNILLFIYSPIWISWLWIPDFFTIQSPKVWHFALHFRSPRRANWHRQYILPDWSGLKMWYTWPWRSWSRTPRVVCKTVALSVNKKNLEIIR